MKELETLAKELHAPARRHYRRRRTVTLGIDDIWQADLVEMHPLASKNKKHNYILTVIDTFSKYGMAVPVKNKTALLVAEAFKGLLKTRQPRNLQTDRGLEFFNKVFKKLMDKHNINHYHTFSDKKAAIVERFNRTLKGRMWKKFTELNSQNWLSILDELVEDYNTSYHRTIKTAPNQVTKKNENEIRMLLDRDHNNQSKKRKEKKPLKAGDIVRISKAKGIFDKGYKFNWSEELFKINKILTTKPVAYHLEDMAGEALQGCFYDEEVMKTKIPNFARIEKVVARRVKNGKKYVRVKWKDYDNKFNSWMLEKDLINL